MRQEVNAVRFRCDGCSINSVVPVDDSLYLEYGTPRGWRLVEIPTSPSTRDKVTLHFHSEACAGDWAKALYVMDDHRSVFHGHTIAQILGLVPMGEGDDDD